MPSWPLNIRVPEYTGAPPVDTAETDRAWMEPVNSTGTSRAGANSYAAQLARSGVPVTVDDFDRGGQG